MTEQRIITAENNYAQLDSYLKETSTENLLLVCDDSIHFLTAIDEYFNTLEDRTGIKVVRFSNFKPNPLYDSAVEGVEILKENNCDQIVAVGGGSAMDVAKCIKLYSNMDPAENYLKQTIVPNDIRLLAIPTTAGTGSEATRYAVLYYNDEKQSITDYSCIPSVVLMDRSVLITLPEYQKKSTMMDALCHATESFWSVNSTEESKKYAKEAIQLVLQNKDAYLEKDLTACENMLKAANLAGKAINISATTAGHAMCYKLTSIYGISHGHAAALCVAKLWPYMAANMDKCIDSRGIDYLEATFMEIAEAMGCSSISEATALFQQIVDELQLETPVAKSPEDFELLANSVNPVRLKNNPIGLDTESANMLYHQIVKG